MINKNNKTHSLAILLYLLSLVIFFNPAKASNGFNCISKFHQITANKTPSIVRDSVNRLNILLLGAPSVFHTKISAIDKKNIFTKTAWLARFITRDFVVPLFKMAFPAYFGRILEHKLPQGLFDKFWSLVILPGLKVFFPKIKGRRIDFSPSQKIFNKLWHDLDYVPTFKEEAILRHFNDLEYYNNIKSRLNKYRNTANLKYYIDYGFDYAKWVSLFYVVNMAITESNGGLVQLDEYLNNSNNKIQLLIDSAPFPHLAIRINNNVYSYGQTHITRNSVQMYFGETIINNSSTKNEHKSGIKEKAYKLINRPRTIQLIDIKLSKLDKINLIKQLEESRGKRYINETFINDCATMIIRKLNKTNFTKINRLIDASPGQVAMYLSYLKSRNHPQVGDIKLVYIDEYKNKKKQLITNSYIHAIESKLFISFFIFHQGLRSIIEPENDNELEGLEPDVKNYMINTWRDQIKKEIDTNTDIISFYRKIRIISNRDMTSSKKNNYLRTLKIDINKYFNDHISFYKKAPSPEKYDYFEAIKADYYIKTLTLEKSKLLELVRY